MDRQFSYEVHVAWTGNKGTHTSAYNAYDRSHTISIAGKADILASSDAPFLGEVTKHNPEDFLVTALSTCHMLWYLHLCADAGILVVDYTDDATGILSLQEGKPGHFSEVILRPKVTVANAEMAVTARELHQVANKKCFIANSVNFPVKHEPLISVAGDL